MTGEGNDESGLRGRVGPSGAVPLGQEKITPFFKFDLQFMKKVLYYLIARDASVCFSCGEHKKNRIVQP